MSLVLSRLMSLVSRPPREDARRETRDVRCVSRPHPSRVSCLLFLALTLTFSLLTSHFSLFAAAASSLGDAESLRVISPSSYTNHAGLAVTGYPIALTAKTTTISNQFETQTLKLSIFPEMERRRLVADWITSHPADIALLRVPRDIRLAIEKNASMIRRSQNRAAKKFCTPEESAAYCAQSHAALESYLDAQEKSGRLLPAERRLLMPDPALRALVPIR